MKRSYKIMAAVVSVVVVIAVFVVVVLPSLRSLSPNGPSSPVNGVSLKQVSAQWSYSTFFDCYVIDSLSVQIKNEGDSTLLDLYGKAEIAGEGVATFSGPPQGLEPGETVTWVGVAGITSITQSGDYTLTAYWKEHFSGSWNLAGSKSIHVP